MSTDNADDQALIEAHARFVALDESGMMDAAEEFQESAYVLGLARGRSTLLGTATEVQQWGEQGLGCWTDGDDRDMENARREGYTVRTLYRIDPAQAPVSVVLPAREMYSKYLRGVIPNNRLEVEAYKDGWNACLDRVKELNP